MRELLDFHPGLEFLENTPEFQEKYSRTVISRIMFKVNTSATGQLTHRELRRSDLLHYCFIVDEEEEINAVNEYFSYEHFYVVYCKFWELDSDHDMIISKDDLMRHGGHALTPNIVDRIFQQVRRKFLSPEPGTMSYEDFAFFLLAEEDKTNAVSVRYWFDCVDLDADGRILPWEMQYFYEEQLQRMRSLGHEEVPFHDVVCQMSDSIKPREEAVFTLEDLLREDNLSSATGVFFNLLFNLNKARFFFVFALSHSTIRLALPFSRPTMH